MDKPRPKFCVGEKAVIMTNGRAAKFNGAVVEIIGLSYKPRKIKATLGRDSVYVRSGWHYGLDIGKTAHESALKKLPPEERTQWEDCAWQPTKQGVEA